MPKDYKKLGIGYEQLNSDMKKAQVINSEVNNKGEGNSDMKNK